MKKKSHKIIFFLLVFFGLFLYTKNITLADGCDDICPSGTHCVTTPIEGTGATDNRCVKDGDSSPGSSNSQIKDFKAQIPFGDTISGPDILNGGGLGKYINNVYKYSVGVVGILATIVIMWGGVRWLTAGGSKEAVDDAKKWISGAVSGLVLILSSYFILNFVNPDLVNFKLIKIKPIAGGDSSSEGTGKMATDINGDTCAQYGTENKIDFSTGKTRSTTDCNKYDTDFRDAAGRYNIDYKLLKALAIQESHCDSNAESSSHACGVMQLLPSTASKLAGTTLNCSDLKGETNYKRNIDLGAKYIAQNRQENIEDQIAGYNSGYGTSRNSDGKLPSLAKSESEGCKELGIKAYQCCKQPGTLSQSQDEVFKVKEYMNGL